MLSIVVCNRLPDTNELVSPNAGAASVWAAATGTAGEDESGAGAAAAAAGAGGTAGAAGAGAELLVVAVVLVDAAGVGLGCMKSVHQPVIYWAFLAHLGYHQYQKILLFDRAWLDTLAIGENFTCKIIQLTNKDEPPMPNVSTRIDKFLALNNVAMRVLNLLLQISNSFRAFSIDLPIWD
jgi:hypothetical protein